MANLLGSHGWNRDLVTSLFWPPTTKVLAMAFTMLYVVWEARNKLLFDGTCPSCEGVLLCFRQLGGTVGASTEVLRLGPAVATFWKPLGKDVIKLNFDPSTTTNQEAGFGMIARNWRGEVMAAAAEFPIDVVSPLLAEMMTFRWAFLLAVDLGFRVACFETDCLQLFQAWWTRRV
ncbi:hypothetical protein OROGR_025586 [Orobanche gracilis]